MDKDFQWWTARRKAELVLALIESDKKLVDACREYDLKQSEVEDWMATFLEAGERGLKMNADDEQAQHERELKELRAIGSTGVLDQSSSPDVSNGGSPRSSATTGAASCGAAPHTR